MQEIIANLDFRFLSYDSMALAAKRIAQAIDMNTEVGEGETADEILLHVRVNDPKSGRGEDFWFR